MKKSMFSLAAILVFSASTLAATAQGVASNPHPLAVSGSNPRPQAVSGSNPRPQSVVVTIYSTVLAYLGF